MQNAEGRNIRILRTGEWSPGQVSLEWTTNTRQIVPEVEAAIDAAWARAMGRPGVQLFDGPMCRLESWQATDDHLRLTLSTSSYKPFLGTNMSHPEFADAFGPEVMADPVGVSSALSTSDGYLLLGHRTQSVAYYPGRIHPFSGCLEPGDADLFAAVARELKEELSLDAGDISDIRCTGIAEDQNLRQPELIFAARSLRTKAALEARLDRIEHHSMFAIKASGAEIESMIRQEPGLTPVAVAALILWGRLHFGQAWFEKLLSMCASQSTAGCQ